MTPGKVFISSGGRLPCRAVAHTVGPIWNGGRSNEEDELEKAVSAALKKADSHDSHRTISVPAISCGIYKFPHEKAASVILNTVRDFLEKGNPSSLTEITVIDGSEKMIQIFYQVLCKMFGAGRVKQESLMPSAGLFYHIFYLLMHGVLFPSTMKYCLFY